MSRRRPGVARHIAAVTCGAVVFAVALSGVLAVELIRHAYDARARSVLHREAVLVAGLLEQPGTTASTRPGRPVGQLLAAAGERLVRVHADGRMTGGIVPAAADVAAARRGRAARSVRTIGTQTYFVDVEPVDSDGGVVVLQRVRDARTATTEVLRDLGIALVAGLIAALALALLLARRLARPLVAVAAAARRLAAGERDVRVPPDGPAEVAEVAESINALATALATSEGRQREFLLSVSHELRTPLTAVRGFAEALADRMIDGEEAVAAGVTIEAEAARLERLVADLLDLARLGADDFRIDLGVVDLAALLRAAAEVWSARCRGVGVRFAAVVPDSPVWVMTDPIRVRQVLDGLAENALRVTPAGRPIVLAVTSEGQAGAGGTGALCVRDGGPGLSEDDLAVAFDRSVLYERYRGVRTVGTGVGLALVGGLVARLGGSITAGHAEEGGAAFTVTLPLAPGSRAGPSPL